MRPMQAVAATKSAIRRHEGVGTDANAARKHHPPYHALPNNPFYQSDLSTPILPNRPAHSNPRGQQTQAGPTTGGC